MTTVHAIDNRAVTPATPLRRFRPRGLRVLMPLVFMATCAATAAPASASSSGAAVPASNVVVTAMTVAPNGTIYAAGRVVTPSSEPFATPPVDPVASSFLMSHDGGVSWTRRDSARNTSAIGASWTNTAFLPTDFTTTNLAVDPSHPQTIYASGCASTATNCGTGIKPGQQHMLLISTNGGTRWTDAVRLSVAVGVGGVPVVSGNIGVNAGLVQAVTRGGSIAGLAVLSSHGRVYACLRGLGLIYSSNGGRGWTYPSQPQSALRGCELVADPFNARIVYALNNAGSLYRTADSGASWMMQGGLRPDVHAHAAGLTFTGHTLWVARADGLYASSDGGARFMRRIAAPVGVSLLDAAHGTGGWVAAALGTSSSGATGLYHAADNGSFRQVAATLTRGPSGYGALDATAYQGYGRRMWNDHAARVVLTSGPEGGIYRWAVGV